MKPLVVFALVCASLPTRGAAAEVTDRVSRTFQAAPGAGIRIDATIADLRIIGSNRPEIAVEIVRHAPSAADFARFPVAVDETASAPRISVVQAADGRDPALRSEITIRAPMDARFESVRVFEGKVTLEQLHAACDVVLQRGPIEASGLAGRIRLETGIGAIDVKESVLSAGGMMRLRVFNGPLRVRFARAPADARILAVTLNGRITSDIPLAMKDQFGPRFGEATLGAGEPVLSLDVVKGDISISVGIRR